MFSSIKQATLMQIRYPNRHRSISAGQVDNMLLLMAEEFPRLNERGSIEALIFSQCFSVLLNNTSELGRVNLNI